jgi:hypothetical protein
MNKAIFTFGSSTFIKDNSQYFNEYQFIGASSFLGSFLLIPVDKNFMSDFSVVSLPDRQKILAGIDSNQYYRIALVLNKNETRDYPQIADGFDITVDLDDLESVSIESYDKYINDYINLMRRFYRR